MAQKFAAEYTPELGQEYLANLLNQNVDEEAANVGRARNEGEAGGLVGQAATGTRIAAAENNYDKNINAAVSGFNLDVAGKKYDERRHDEDQSFQDTERTKTEDFQKQLAQMGYNFQDSEREAMRKADNQFNGVGFFTGLGTAAAGGFAKGAGMAAA